MSAESGGPSECICDLPGYHLSRYDRLAEPCVCDTGFTCLAVAHDASFDCPHDEWFEEGDEDGGTGWTCASCGKHEPRKSAWCMCGLVDDRGDGTCGNCGLRIMTDDDS